MVSFNRLPLPEGVELKEEEFTILGDKMLLVLGAVIDEEFNFLVMDLEVLMVDSIYKIDLSRPKNGFFDKKKPVKRLKKLKVFYMKNHFLENT